MVGREGGVKTAMAVVKEKKAMDSNRAFALMDEGLTMVNAALDALAERRRAAGFGEKFTRRHRRDFAGAEAAMAELRALSPEAQRFLNHHIRNVLSGVITYCTLEKHEEAQQVALQLVDVLEAIAPLPMEAWKDAHGL